METAKSKNIKIGDTVRYTEESKKQIGSCYTSKHLVVTNITSRGGENDLITYEGGGSADVYWLEKVEVSAEERIKALEERHRKEISDLRASLVKPDFRVDKWYTDGERTFKITKIDGSRLLGFGQGVTNWCDENCISWGTQGLRLATEEEIKTALVAEAQKRGLIRNAKTKDGKLGGSYFIEPDGSLWNNGMSFNIMLMDSQGKWAEIITTPKLTFGGHEVTIDGHKITCKDVVGSYEELKKIYDELNSEAKPKFGNKELTRFRNDNDEEFEYGTNDKVTDCKIGCTWGTMLEIKQILEAVELQRK